MVMVEKKIPDEGDEQPRLPHENSLQVVPKFPTDRLVPVDDGPMVMVTESDLNGYNDTDGGGVGLVGNEKYTDESFVCRVQFAGQEALARLSCMWIRTHSGAKLASSKVRLPQVGSIKSIECSCAGGGTDQLSGRTVDIPVF